MSLRLVGDPTEERLRAGLERLDRAIRLLPPDEGTAPAVFGLDDVELEDEDEDEDPTPPADGGDVVELLSHRLNRNPAPTDTTKEN